jgi:hypothetical protein
MNGVRTTTVLPVWQSPCAGDIKSTRRRAASLEKAFDGFFWAACLIGAIAAVGTGVVDLTFFSDVLAGFFSGSLWECGFFKSLPVSF